MSNFNGHSPQTCSVPMSAVVTDPYSSQHEVVLVQWYGHSTTVQTPILISESLNRARGLSLHIMLITSDRLRNG